MDLGLGGKDQTCLFHAEHKFEVWSDSQRQIQQGYKEEFEARLILEVSRLRHYKWSCFQGKRTARNARSTGRTTEIWRHCCGMCGTTWSQVQTPTCLRICWSCYDVSLGTSRPTRSTSFVSGLKCESLQVIFPQAHFNSHVFYTWMFSPSLTVK